MSREAVIPTVVYVHGAGPQNPADQLKMDFDAALFGQPGQSVALRYAGVIWGDERPPGLVEALEAIAAGTLSPHESASRVWELLVSTFGPLSDEFPDAEIQGTTLVGDWFRAATGIEQRRVAAFEGFDVLAYLYFGYAGEMQAPVFEGVSNVPGPILVIAHSLGSILTYDLLRRNDFPRKSIPLLVTAGSPLGLPFILATRKAWFGRNPLRWIPDWANFADPNDVVAKFGMNLADDYKPSPPTISDAQVDNKAQNNHDLPGYLRTTSLRGVVNRAIAPGAG